MKRWPLWLGALAASALASAGARAESRDTRSVPLVRAEPGPVKVRPDDPGGLKVPHGEKSIYDRIRSRPLRDAAPEAGKRRQMADLREARKNAAAIGPYRAQIGSFRSAKLAEQEWAKLQARHRDLLGKLKMVVQPADLGGQGQYYRLQAGPLPSAKDAQALCGALIRRSLRCIQVKA